MPLTIHQKTDIYNQAVKDVLDLPRRIIAEQQNQRMTFRSEAEVASDFKPGYWKKHGARIMEEHRAMQAKYNKNAVSDLEDQLKHAKLRMDLFKPLPPLEEMYKPGYLKRYHTKLLAERQKVEEQLDKKQKEYLETARRSSR